MKVTLLASTQVTPAALHRLPLLDAGTSDLDHLAEIAGRLCYRSEHRPSPRTAANADYLANVLGQGHESVVAHASASFLIEDVSRSLTHELIRHRWPAYSELSQRYCDASDFRPVYPPDADEVDRGEIDATFGIGIEGYSRAVERGLARGLTRKRARQAARAHLPLCTETKIVTSANLRSWRDVLRQRVSEHADREIALLGEELLRQLLELAPATFADLAGLTSEVTT